MQAREALRHGDRESEDNAQLAVLRSIDARLAEIARLLGDGPRRPG